jgi:signal peptidase I
MSRPVHALREAALWIAAVIGTICLLAAVAAVAFGMTPLIFRSGSMSPGIPTGSLGISVATPAADLKVGDIVSVVWANDTRVTHRVARIEPAGDGRFTLTTRGDANELADTEKVTLATVDRVLWSTPQAGYVLEEATKPQWVFGLGVVVGALVILAFRGSRPREADARVVRLPEQPQRHARRRGMGAVAGTSTGTGTGTGTGEGTGTRAGTGTRTGAGRGRAVGASSIAVLAIAGSLLANAPTGTLASFTDSGVVGSPYTSTRVQPPSPVNCVVSGLVGKTVTLSWAAPATGPTPTSYLVSWSGATTGSQVVTPPTMSIPFTSSLLGLGTTNVVVSSRYPTNWVSTATPRSITFVTSLAALCGNP